MNLVKVIQMALNSFDDQKNKISGLNHFNETR